MSALRTAIVARGGVATRAEISDRLGAPLLAAGLFFVFALTATYSRHQNVDAVSALLPAWKLAQHGTLNIPEYLHFTPWINESGGQVLSDRMPGVILFAAPFYLLLGIASGPTFYPAAIAAALAAALAITLLFSLLRRLAGTRVAAAAALLAAFGTGTWTVSADALWPHGPSQLWLVLGMVGLASHRWWLAGASYALAILTRPHLAFAAAIGGIWASVVRRSQRPMLVIGGFSLLGVGALLIYNRIVFDSARLLVGTYAGREDLLTEWRFSFIAENAAGTLFSPARGVLVMSPFLLLLIPGVPTAWRVAPAWVRSSALGGVTYLTVQLTGNYFAGGSGFYSYRLPLETLTLAAPLLTLCWTQWTSVATGRRAAFAVLAVISVAEHAVGAIVDVRAHSLPSKAWTEFLPAVGLQQATAWQLAAILVVAVIAIAVTWRLFAGNHEAPAESARA